MATSLDSVNYRVWIFNIIKYLVYGYLCYNGLQFYADETAAGATTFQNGLSLASIIEVYSATIDTTFWIMLVVLLELETYIIDDEVLHKASVKWSLMGARGVCYGMIVWAWYGYIVKFLFQADIDPMSVADACTLVSQNFSLLLGLEEYVRLDNSNCSTLAGQELFRLGGHNIVAPLADLEYARNVAMIDIFNSSSWIGVVIILEVDLWYQLKGAYTGRIYWISYVIKAILYSILIGCALAWGYTGVWLDISDAALWLFAFFFIELNLFQWHEETEEEAQQQAA
ncbi:MAG: hypothetical protein OEZ23_07830 [Gammaproteobacteria bacterium]|nr:hypothetical protein [Gammaproteobacteria bacterium]